MHTAELCRRLANRGERVTLVCHDADAELDAVANVIRVPRPNFGNWPFFWRFAAPLRFAADHLAPARIPLEDPYALIVSDLHLWWMLRRRFLRVPFIYLPHALVAPTEVESYQFQSALQKRLAVRTIAWLERRALQKAIATVRFSKIACDEMSNYYEPETLPKFELLAPPVVIPERFRERREPGPIRLLSVGRLVESKNVSFLFRALSPLAAIAWKLDIVGNGELRARLEHEAGGLADRVHFYGHRDDVDSFYENADLFLLPSKLENAPLVLLEAMSHGLPTLSFRNNRAEYRNANHEIIEHGKTGFLAEAEIDFTQLLADLLKKPDRLPAVGRAARVAVEQRHDWETYVAKLLKCFEVETTKHTNHTK